ncbi:MAG: hypothetical protein DDT29_00374 [Dehalococcoidia bacterium]|nr:hypothetical protein [Bacillota bacterium]
MELKIAYGDSRMTKQWSNKKITFKELCERFKVTRRTNETVSEYKKFTKAKRDGIKDIGGYVLGHLKGGRRKRDMVESRSGITLDADYANTDFVDVLERTFPHQCAIYSTHSHTPEEPRLRVVIPLTREVSPDEYTALSRLVAEAVGIDFFDDSTYEPHRLMYWPSTSSDGEYIFKEINGEILDPDTYLAKLSNWRDCSLWPTSKRQSAVMQRKVGQQQDPLAKLGVVGAFCRAYSIEAAILAFLSGVYEPSVMDGRYDYIPADSAAGVVIYDGKFAYSHHATDPACGRLLNAFDLVRIHKFTDLDEKASFKAMSAIAVQNEKVKLQLAEERQSQAVSDFEDADWQKKLEHEKDGRVKDTLSNISRVLKFDTALQPIVYNQLKHMLDVIGTLPWPQVKPGWNDTDIACAKVYFERTYGIWSPVKFKDALLAVVSTERLYHPVKDYLSGLAWDGVERLDTLLVDYLGAEDTPYTRAVTRKTLVAAVARIYRPGVKFDSILVLNGAQGIGKSLLFARLGRKWFSDSLSISDMKDKTAAEKLQGYWILELGELAGIKKIDVEVVKSFITRTDDKYRQAYGVVVESHPRSCIIVGSTNSDGGFLRDITGNRRFWPVRVTGQGKYCAWDLVEVDQIWAEAVKRYQDGEDLYLSGDLVEEAVNEQRDALECDEREGIVIEYLDTLLPDNWEKMDINRRLEFLRYTDDPTRVKGHIRRTQVSVMEIWCECFGKPRENLKMSDTYEIRGILNRIDGWVKDTNTKTGKRYLPFYGPQRVFTRP